MSDARWSNIVPNLSEVVRTVRGSSFKSSPSLRHAMTLNFDPFTLNDYSTTTDVMWSRPTCELVYFANMWYDGRLWDGSAEGELWLKYTFRDRPTCGRRPNIQSLNRYNSAAYCSISLKFGTSYPIHYESSRSKGQSARSQRDVIKVSAVKTL